MKRRGRALRHRYGHASKRDTRDSTKILKAADRIMDKMQSFSIRAGYRDAPESAKIEARAFAVKAIPDMRALETAMKASDDPGGAWTISKSIERLERLSNYSWSGE